jgi:hypothetical protein
VIVALVAFTGCGRSPPQDQGVTSRTDVPRGDAARMAPAQPLPRCLCVPSLAPLISQEVRFLEDEGYVLHRTIEIPPLVKSYRDDKAWAEIAESELRRWMYLLCKPCTFDTKHLAIEDMFPMDRLNEAVGATCMGLILRSGETVYGRARPANTIPGRCQ